MNTNIAEEIKKLKELLDQGALTQQEFEEAKKKILAQDAVRPMQTPPPMPQQIPPQQLPPQQVPPQQKSSSGCGTAFLIVFLVFLFLGGIFLAWSSCSSSRTPLSSSSAVSTESGESLPESSKIVLDASEFAGKTIEEIKEILPETEDSGTVDLSMANGETVTANYYSYYKDGVTIMFSVLDSKVVTANIMWDEAQTYSGDKKEIISLLGITPGKELEEVTDTNSAIRWECVSENVSEVWVTTMDSDASTFSGVKITYDSAVSGRLPGEPEKADLELLSVDSESDGVSRYVVGKIRNNTDKTYHYVSVSINLYSGDNVVGSTLDNINNLEPGAIWEFKAYILNEDADQYKVVDISGF